MRVTELVTKKLGKCGNKEILEQTGKTGNTYDCIGDWLLEKQAAGIPVKNVTLTFVVRGIDHWTAFEEFHPNGAVVTIFWIHD